MLYSRKSSENIHLATDTEKSHFCYQIAGWPKHNTAARIF
jgi:hypothetical protein